MALKVMVTDMIGDYNQRYEPGTNQHPYHLENVWYADGVNQDPYPQRPDVDGMVVEWMSKRQIVAQISFNWQVYGLDADEEVLFKLRFG